MSTIPPDIVSLADYERVFLARTTPPIRAYVAGAASDGLTHRANREGFDRLTLAGRVLRDMSGANTRLQLFGQTIDCPIILAPVAFHKLVHPEGEIATAIGTWAARTIMTVSTLATVRLEDIAHASGNPKWFQIYFQRRRDDTLRLVRRAEDAGYLALVITVDAPVNGIRNMEQRAGFTLPPEIPAVNIEAAEQHFENVDPTESPVFKGLLDGAPTWDDIAWLRKQTQLPIILKGIMHPDDADESISYGADGIVVSNHGGRVLDTLPASITVLPAIAERVGKRIPILLDGGIRRGTDVLKALALGATAVLVGRPQLYALAIGGASGVAHMLTILRTELETAMTLTGCSSLDAADGKLLWRDNAGP